MATTRFPITHINATRALQSVFTTTPNLLARQTRFRQRESKLTGSVFVQTLAFGWLNNPDATLEELAQVAGSLGVSISPQGLDQRFGPQAADLLQQVLHDAVVRVMSTDPVVVPLLQRFAGGVCLLDSTTFTLPAVFAGAWPSSGPNEELGGIKAQVRLNLLDGTLQGPFLCPARDNDRKGVLHTAPLPTGALHLADLGFFCLRHLQALDQQKVFWLTRVKAGTHLRDATGREWTLAAFLRSQPSDTVDVSLRVGRHYSLACRFLAIRVPPAVAAVRRRRLQKRAKSRGWKMHADRHALAEWNVWVTNVPQEKLSIHEAWVLARCRWQIELLFKLWKSEGHVDKSRSEKPWRILCEIYAKLLGMVVQHWLLLVGCWSHQDRSLVKASRTVRRYAVALAAALPDSHLVFGLLSTIQISLRSGCRVKRRRRDPPTHQLLCDLPKTG